MSYNVKANAKLINARSLEIGKTAKEIAKAVHTHLIDITRHITLSSGDVTTAKRFVAALSVTKAVNGEKRDASSIRVDAVVKWMKAFGLVSIDKEGNFTLNKKAWKEAEATEGGFPAYLKEIAKTPWNTYTTAKNPLGVFVVDDAIDRMIDSLEKQIKEAKAGLGRFERQDQATRAQNQYESDRLGKLFALRSEKAA